MRIASLVPHATELLFALGLDDEVRGVTHECDYPAAARTRARLTRDVLPTGLSAGEIDAAVRERTLSGESIYALDERALAACEPDLIVTQALCPVCAVSYEDVTAIAGRLPGRPRVIALDPSTLEQTHEDVRTLAAATGREEQGARLLEDAHERLRRVAQATRGRERQRVLALEWLDPFYVAGHWTPEMIALAGGEDVVGVAGERSRAVSAQELEQAALADGAADVVIVMPCGYDARQAAAQARAHADALARTRAQRIVAVNASAYFSRPGPRLTDGVELLAHVLHPAALPAPPSAREAIEVRLTAAAR
ncbi:MAG TPA: ABC transporter substrate-binding protein [Solirubrobacteraceae bacterium]|nr:ABC transporter substrate-binding protein [Solirubrobacteraceae bacterium]